MSKHRCAIAGLSALSLAVLAGCSQSALAHRPTENMVTSPNPSAVTNQTNTTGGSIPTSGNSTSVNPDGVMIPAAVPFLKLRAGPLNAVSFLSDTTGFVAGDDGIYKTTDGGETWARVYTSKVPILGIHAMFQPVGQEQYVVAYTQTYLLRSTDGQHFTMQGVGGNKDGGGDPHIEGLSLLDNNVIYLLNDGIVWASDGESGGLYRATPPEKVTSISASSVNTCYAVAGTAVYKTTDDGHHWTRVFTAPLDKRLPWKAQVESQENHVAVLFYGGDGGMSQTAYILFESNDAGRTWQAMLDEGYFSPDYHGAKPLSDAIAGERPGPFTMDPQGDIFITGVDENDGNMTVITAISPDGKTLAHDPVGASTNSPHAFDDFSLDRMGIATWDGKHIFVVGGKNGKGVVEISEDGGLTWR